MRKILVLSACLLIGSDASAQNANAIKQAATACGDSSVNFHVKKHHTYGAVPPVPKGEARIYVFEAIDGIVTNNGAAEPLDFNENGPPYYKATIRVGMDGQWIGADKGNSYLFFSAEPGEHHLCANWQSGWVGLNHLIQLAGISVQADQTYYFLAIPIEDSLGLGLLNLRPLDSDEAQLMLVEYPLAVATAHK